MIQPAFAVVAAVFAATGRGHPARMAECKTETAQNSQKES